MEKQTVLIVDDIVDNLNVAANTLIPQNINVIFAQSGENALKTADKYMPDLILLDIMMPQMDGFEVCEKLKSNEKTKEIPIIFLTAIGEAKFIVKGFKLGAIDYINKPFIAEELISRVTSHLKIYKLNKDLNQNNKLLQQKHNEILASIRYAQVIQKAVLPEEQFLSHFLPNNFIINIPRDIVSGDFYWIKQRYNQVFIAVADCTGHGVPGAFMSMLGIAYLNEIVYNFKNETEVNAGEILNTLRNRIKISLHQDKRKDTVSDGMDIALCIIDLENKNMQYAGAYNPLFLIRKDQQNTHELIQFKADRMPIAIHLSEKPFTNNNIELQTDDMVYIFSDGFLDQIGGEYGRKYLVKNFKELLLQNANKKMDEQKKAIKDTFYSWKGEKEQIDDVMIIGFKISESYGDIEFL